MLDIRIKGAKVYDGSGNPWFTADVGAKDGRITSVGVVNEKARRTIRGAGLALCPGFVDIHTHADDIARNPAAANVVRQGVTTVISGNCGGSALPVGTWLDEVEAARPAINYATLVGHGTVRRTVMGMDARRPTPRELGKMRRLVEQAMREGAVGMSTGLFYVPGAYAEVDELVALSRVVAAHGGTYASHKRSAGGKMIEAIAEAAAVGKGAGIPIEISHLKALHRRGRTKAGRIDEALAAIRRHREDGVEMTCDVHPYPATYTSLSAVAIPPHVASGGKLIERLKDAAARRGVRKESAGRIAWMGGAGKITIAGFKPDPSLEGKSLAEIARLRRRDPVATAMDLIVEGEPSAIFHALRPADVRQVVCAELTMIASDGGVVPERKGVVHPRYYGTFPRVLREYVRERGLLSFEDAVRKMTYMPARKFGLRDRGLVAPGMAADLVLFDPDTIGENATFEDPHAYPTGIACVIVNGRVAWNGRSLARERSGQVIRGCR